LNHGIALHELDLVLLYLIYNREIKSKLMSKEHGSTAADVVRQAELLVMDYLRGTKCKRALDKMTSKISGSPSVIASELYALDLEKKRASNSNATVLNYMVSSASKNAPSSGSSSSRKSSSYTSESNESRTTSSFSADVDWTKEEISLLKKAIKNTSHITDKTERWKQIAAEVGNGKNKKHCYLKYKELREEKKNASPKSSTRRSSHISEDSADERTSSTSSRADSDTESGSISKETLKASKVLERKAVVEKEELLGFTRMTSSVGSNKILAPSKSSKQEIQVEDCEDFDSVVPSKRSSTSSTTASSTMSSYTSSNTHSSSSTYNFKIESRPPSVEEIEAMRKILLPDEKKSFSSHWEQQGFFFSDIDGLKYGLVQHEGGPCGVLAVVQAYVLRYLLAHEEEDEETWRNVSLFRKNFVFC
jgi:guanyl-specific ribonuclease Sa